MPIKKCKDQDYSTLQEFYTDPKVPKPIGEATLKLISWLNETFKTTEIFGLTSHYRLVLLSENSSSANSNVIISAMGIRYYFEYLIPTEEAPWEHAHITGFTDNFEDAKKYILLCIKKSKGWESSVELMEL